MRFRNTRTEEVIAASEDLICGLNTRLMLTPGSEAWEKGLWIHERSEAEINTGTGYHPTHAPAY